MLVTSDAVPAGLGRTHPGWINVQPAGASPRPLGEPKLLRRSGNLSAHPSHYHWAQTVLFDSPTATATLSGGLELVTDCPDALALACSCAAENIYNSVGSPKLSSQKDAAATFHNG